VEIFYFILDILWIPQNIIRVIHNNIYIQDVIVITA